MIFRTVAAVLLAGLVAGPALGQAPSMGGLDDALVARDWARAESIAAALDAEAGQGDIMAAYAAAARHADAGQCVEAVTLADLVIEQIPFFVPPYLISYRCHRALGQSDAAQARLTALTGIIPEGPERDLVERLLQSERASGAPAFSGYVNVAPSSNVNRQTDASVIDGGLWGPGTIPEDARGQRGVMLEAGGSMAVQLRRGENVSVSGVLRADVQYSSVDEIIQPRLTAELPITFRLTETMQAVLAPYGAVEFAEDTHILTEGGVRGTISMPLGAQQRLALDLKLAGIDRPTRPERDGYVVDGAVSVSTGLAPNVNFTATGRGVYTHTADDSLSTLLLTAQGRFDVLFESGLLAGVEGTYGKRYHNRPAPFVLEENQIDTFVTGRVDVSHREITVGPLMPTLYYEYTNSWSDNVFYDYESHDIGISLRASF